MKKIILIFWALLIAGSIVYFARPADVVAPVLESTGQSEIFNTERLLNLEFIYRKNPDGYILIEDETTSTENLLERVSLFNEAEYLEMKSYEFPTEYPPSISLSVYRNDMNLSALAWVEENSLESNFTLRRGEWEVVDYYEVEVIKYTVDGLYLFDVYIFVHKNQIYLLSGAYFTGDTPIYKDFNQLLAGLKFR